MYNHSYALSVIDPRWAFYANGSRHGSVLHPMAAQDNATKRGVVRAGPLNPQNRQVHAVATWEDSMRQHYALHHARKSCAVCPPGTWTEGKTGQIKCISKPKLVQHTCATDEYESTPGTNLAAHVCTRLTVCTSSEFEKAAPSTSIDFDSLGHITNDRKCEALTVCKVGEQYESAPPSATNDRVCSLTSTCTLLVSYEVQAPTGTTDRACDTPTVCNAGTQYEVAPPTLLSNRTCAELTVCAAGECEAATATATSDRVCQARVVTSTCVAADAATCACTTTATNDAAPGAMVWHECPSGTVQTSGSALSAVIGPECKTVLSHCPGGSYMSAGPPDYADRECSPHKECNASSYISFAGDNLHDRECTAFSQPCDYATERMGVAPTSTQDRVCLPLSLCGVSQFESNYGARGETDDRECTSFLPCTSTTYQSAAPVVYGANATGPQCTNFTVCDATSVPDDCALRLGGWGGLCTESEAECKEMKLSRPEEYESVAATPTSDRVCNKTTATCSTGMFFESGWNSTSDLVCKMSETCAYPSVQIRAATHCSRVHCAAPDHFAVYGRHAPTNAFRRVPTMGPTQAPPNCSAGFPATSLWFYDDLEDNWGGATVSIEVFTKRTNATGWKEWAPVRSLSPSVNTSEASERQGSGYAWKQSLGCRKNGCYQIRFTGWGTQTTNYTHYRRQFGISGSACGTTSRRGQTPGSKSTCETIVRSGNVQNTIQRWYFSVEDGDVREESHLTCTNQNRVQDLFGGEMVPTATQHHPLFGR